MSVAGVLRGEASGFEPGQVSGAAWAWLAYLVLIGAIVVLGVALVVSAERPQRHPPSSTPVTADERVVDLPA